VKAHGAVASEVLGNATLEAVLADYRTAPISDKLRATLAFLEKVTTAPDTLAPADARAVLDTGVTRQGVKDALHVAAMFNAINRLADAFDFEVGPPASFTSAAKTLLRFGYAL
jgi:alkylhydroperoxidase family enzyme